MHRPRLLPHCFLHCPSTQQRESVSRLEHGPVCLSAWGSLCPGVTQPHRPWQKRREATDSAISGTSRHPVLAARAPSPSDAALLAAGGGLRRRRASAASSVSRGGLRSSLRLLFCPPTTPASLLPLPELRRVQATLCAAAGTKKDPAAAVAPPLPQAFTCSPPAAAAAPERPAHPSQASARPYRALAWFLHPAHAG